MAKNMRDVKKEYGMILRWIHGGKFDGIESGIWIWLENTHDDEKRIYITKDGEIINQDAYDFIRQETLSKFKSSYFDVYDTYVKLFEIIGVNKLCSLISILKEKNMSITKLSKETRLPRTSVSNIVHGIVEFNDTSVEKALAISKALDMSIDELYNKLYFSRESD